MPNFTLKQLFTVVTILSMCFAAITFLVRFHVIEQLKPVFAIVVWFIPGGLIGSLLLAPIKRPRFGMLLGIISELLLLHLFGRY